MEAVQQWALSASPQPTERVPLSESLGRVLAEPAAADSDYPGFDNSAVDGYVLGCEEDACQGTELRVAGSIVAGAAVPQAPEQGTCYRILTGAPVPDASYAVIMQEDVERIADDKIRLAASAQPGSHIRRRGSDFRRGDVLLHAGTRLNPGHLGLLATLGISQPCVRAQPRVAILTTGDEIVRADEPKSASQVRDSNGPMLSALTRCFGGDTVLVAHVYDNAATLEQEMRNALDAARVVVVTGGASVGDRDYAPVVAGRLGEIAFHGVSVKPGKPTLFATAGDQAILCLPGNPGATFVGAHLYLRAMIAALQRERYTPRWLTVQFRDAHRARDRDDLLRARLDWSTSPPTAFTEFEQGSFALTSLAECDCLVRFPAGEEHRPGDLRQAMLLEDR